MDPENPENILRLMSDQNGLVDQTKYADLVKQNLEQIMAQEIEQKAYREALHRKKVSMLMKHRITEEMLEGKHDTATVKYSEYAKKDQENQAVRFITLSLPPTDPPGIPKLIEFWNDYIKSRKWLRKVSWVWEQRGEDEKTYLTGIHIHVVTPVTKKHPHEIIRDINAQTKLEKNFIDIQARTAGHCFNYLLTEKKPEYKKLRQKFDEKFRSEFNLIKIYSK